MFKPPQIGTVTVTVEEVRGLSDITYLEVIYEEFEKKTHALEKVKDVTDQKWNETFSFKVHSLQSDVEIVAVHKNLLIGHKKKGHYKVPIPSLQDGVEKHDWFPLTKISKSKDIRKLSKEAAIQVGEVRLSAKYEPLHPKVEKKIKGLVVDGEWTKENPSGGTLMNHPMWFVNPQILLDVEWGGNIVIKLTQPEGVDEKVSFQVVKYENSWSNKPKVVFVPDEIIKIDNFWAALFSEEVEVTLKLDDGKYIIVPCTMDGGYDGKFSVNVWRATENEEKEEDKDKPDPKAGEGLKLTLLEADKWKTKSVKGQWTKSTAGAGNISGVKWRRNPQILFTPEEDMEVTVVLSQEAKDYSIGMYMIKYEGYGKKVIEYTNEVAKTDSFKFNPSVGIRSVWVDKGQQYCIIPCTSEPKEGHFTVTVFATKNFQLEEITQTWKHIATSKGIWRTETSGGSPNSPSFPKNPQYLLELPNKQRAELFIDLVVSDEHDAVGFLAFKREKENPPTRIRDNNIQAFNVICKPDGWTKRMTIGAYTVVSEKNVEDEDLLIIPSTFEPGVRKRFELAVYSDEPVVLKKLGDEGIVEDKAEESSSEEEEEEEDD